ncbi:adenylate/guanylate cyclase domain-containing protein [Sinorhizobium sp. BG8]|uniref:adenylate/guanylate cyclase domain-containing protein n=1 Tax=Sinorhizobium sp. BG8 TaxID=2613773 RepID=UPI00193DE1A2|nr:adenylate/guanylate cyclase domain-containing protein [Sinorhizobium sp. BG8]QRM55276.1 adenylate/guanylate cyclase domain-containing protein [Sinorhizobium sp. BG8]
MHWSKPLRLHLSVLVATLLLCISTPLIWMAFNQGRQAAILAGEKQMRQMSLRLVEGYRYALEGGYEAVAVASTLPQLITRPPLQLQEKQAFFLEVLRNVTNATSVLGGYPDGSFIQAINTADPHVRSALRAPEGTAFAVRIVTPQSAEGGSIAALRFVDAAGRLIEERPFGERTFDARDRPWYRAVVRSGAPTSVGPFVSGTLRVPTLTVAVPMRDDAQTVIGVNIHLETISRLLYSRDISPRARSFILDDQNRLVAHSDPAMMSMILGTWSQRGGPDQGAAKETDRTIETVTRLRKDMLDGKDGMARFELDGESYLVQISPVTFSNLFKGSSVAVVVPLDDLLEQANRQLVRNLLMAAGFVVVGIGASILLSRLISASLYQLADEARKIGDLDFAGKGTTHSWITEINTLASALTASRRAIAQFALYVPREVVRRIVSPTDISTNAARQEVTVLFTDIRDFTTIAEVHPPEEVVEILSSYFELLNVIAERHGGTVVQYLGDSLFVMWNAPIPDSDHVANGCRCALAMKAAIGELNASNCKNGRPELFTRFGLHSGPAVVGSFGAVSRQQYTAMGDTINVASRLEGLNKEYGTSVLASATVEKAAAALFEFRPIGPVKLKGRAESVEVFELRSAREHPALS